MILKTSYYNIVYLNIFYNILSVYIRAVSIVEKKLCLEIPDEVKENAGIGISLRYAGRGVPINMGIE